MNHENLLRQQLVELLRGGFAPNVILFKEFDHQKAGVVLDGLHFSAWILLGHIRHRQKVLLDFMKHPDECPEIWPEAHWPDNYQPKDREEWEMEISKYQAELEEVIHIIGSPETEIFTVLQNGKTRSWAAMTLLHHTGYHIGQLKTIGRQLGVW